MPVQSVVSVCSPVKNNLNRARHPDTISRSYGAGKEREEQWSGLFEQ
jgi:hypothetical protein